MDRPVTDTWAARMGLADRELIAFVGAGGKTTLMAAVAHELADAGRNVVVTTTTQMAIDELEPPVVSSLSVLMENLGRSHLLYWAVPGSEDKATGPTPEEVNALFTQAPVDYVLVEADGASGKPIKAPAVHEPVIPGQSTIVVVVVGVDAIGQTITSAAHRPERLAQLLDKPLTHELRAEDVAAVITSASGGLKNVPARARVILALSRVGPEDVDLATELAAMVSTNPDVARAVVVPRA